MSKNVRCARNFFWQDADTLGMIVAATPFTSIHTMPLWAGGGGSANEAMRLFVDAAWMAGVADAEQFSRDAEIFLRKVEQGQWKKLDRFPKKISRFLEALSPDNLEKMKTLLPLVKGPVTPRSANNPTKPTRNEDKIPMTQTRLRQIAENARWEPSTALVWGGKEYIVEAISPSGKLILREERFSPFPSDWEGFLVLDSDETLEKREKTQPFSTPASIASETASPLPCVDVIGSGTEWGSFAYYLLPDLSKFWKQGNLPPIEIISSGKRGDNVSPGTVRYWLSRFPPFLWQDLKRVVLADKANGHLGANYENGVMTLFPLRRKEDLIVLLLHELMHHVANRVFGETAILENAEWAEAIRKDERYVSRYAFSENRNEDFAETATLYFLSGRGVLGNIRSWFPHRFRLLDEIFRDCFQENPPPLPPTVT